MSIDDSDYVDCLVAERDELKARVKELTDTVCRLHDENIQLRQALQFIRNGTPTPSTVAAEALGEFPSRSPWAAEKLTDPE